MIVNEYSAKLNSKDRLMRGLSSVLALLMVGRTGMSQKETFYNLISQYVKEEEKLFLVGNYSVEGQSRLW